MVNGSENFKLIFRLKNKVLATLFTQKNKEENKEWP